MKNTKCLLILAIVLSMGCSLKKTAEDTAATTKEMNETTKEMNQNTKEMKETTKEMDKNTKELMGTSEALREMTAALESELTYKESHDQMMKHMDWLFMETHHKSHRGLLQSLWELLFGLNEDPDLFIAGGGTILSMHFQFWKGLDGEDVAELDKRLELGSEVLFDRLFKHIPRHAQVDVLRPGTSYKGVAALGAKLELIDERYERGLKRRELPRLTYYDFIVMALRNRDALHRSELFPRTVAKILQWEHEAVYLLQLRHNILPVMVMARTTDFQDRKDLSRAWMWWRGQKIDVSGANPEALKEWTSWLKKASQTRKDLRLMGIEPQYNRVLNDLVAGIDFGQKEILGRSPRNARERLLRDFAAAYVQAVNEAAKPLPVRPALQADGKVEEVWPWPELRLKEIPEQQMDHGRPNPALDSFIFAP